MLLLLKSRDIDARLARLKGRRGPEAGDPIEFASDRHTDKGPSAGTIEKVKATVDGIYVLVRHSDGQDTLSWDDIDAQPTSGGGWLVKAVKAPKPGRVVKEGGRAKVVEDLDGLIREHEQLIMVLRKHPDAESQAAAAEEAGELDGFMDRKSEAATMAKSGPHPVSAGWKAPTPAQAKAGNYRKPRMRWEGMEVVIECPVGTVRSGRDRDGKEWSVRMLYPYGYLAGTMGVDGDPFDCYIGPEADAQMVYVITTRKPGRWDEDDEQKAMIGFASQDDACASFLKHFNDPRFLGACIAMPVGEFVEKVKATCAAPRLIVLGPQPPA